MAPKTLGTSGASDCGKPARAALLAPACRADAVRDGITTLDAARKCAATNIVEITGFSRSRLDQARAVLRCSVPLAEAVRDGITTRDAVPALGDELGNRDARRAGPGRLRYGTAKRHAGDFQISNFQFGNSICAPAATVPTSRGGTSPPGNGDGGRAVLYPDGRRALWLSHPVETPKEKL
jgi:hypothetical protein